MRITALISLAAFWSLTSGVSALDFTQKLDEKVEAAYMADLNRYTTEAPLVMLFGKTHLTDANKTGKPVRILGRGEWTDLGGISLPEATLVLVGEPCSSCTANITYYPISSGSGALDDIIVVFEPE